MIVNYEEIDYEKIQNEIQTFLTLTTEEIVEKHKNYPSVVNRIVDTYKLHEYIRNKSNLYVGCKSYKECSQMWDKKNRKG